MPTLREARMHAGLSMRQLARKADVSATTIYLLETHQRKPHPLTVHKLSRVLGVDPLTIDEFRATYERVSVDEGDEGEIAP